MRVLVTGDVALDINIYRGQREKPWTPKGPGTRKISTPGGASLLRRLLAESSSQGAAEPCFETSLGIPEELLQDLPEELHGYCLWEGRPGPVKKGGDGRKRQTRVWRLTSPLGYGGEAPASGVFSKVDGGASGPADIIVLDDGNLGFRSQTSSAAWPGQISKPGEGPLSWVVLKMADPLCEGDLWRACVGGHGARTIALVNLEDIRQMEVRVTKGVSWERTALDLVSELERNPMLSPLKALKFLVVRIGFEGALVVQRTPEVAPTFTLVFDPEEMEDDWAEAIEGRGMGFMSTLTAAVVFRLAHDDRPPDEAEEEDKKKSKEQVDLSTVIDGVRAGLVGIRTLLTEGHREIGIEGAPGFPFDEVAAAIRDRDARAVFTYASVPVLSGPAAAGWSFLDSARGEDGPRSPLYGHAHCLALKGPAALRGIPYQRFGKLLTMDRAEIESLRNLRRLVDDYRRNDKVDKPLSLAVFGPPGSGKSFGIKQIARGILGKNVPLPEFNLSQFSDPKDLIGALHHVRDKVLEGTTPVVFWDEFDSKGYTWLQYLLAPMQDGKFQEGQVTHPIGKCIFVFAGGTSWDYKNFGPREPDRDVEKDPKIYEKKKEAWDRFKLLKGPDFLSRLSGYLNVLGPNPRCEWNDDRDKWVPQVDDVCFPLRRAILLRAMSGLGEDDFFDIDPGLLSAFMELPKYKHGARSLEKILEQARQRGRSGRLRRSDLPPAALLELHADYGEFMRIAERDMEFAAWADVLAPAIHAFWYQHMKENGWKTTLPEDYAALSTAAKADNIAAARRIPSNLRLVGLRLQSSDAAQGETDAVISRLLTENMELLAEAEHDGWMEHKLRNGWEYHKTRNNGLLRHNLIIPYKALSEGEKDKDRNAVRHFPEMVALAGYRIVTEPPAET